MRLLVERAASCSADRLHRRQRRSSGLQRDPDQRLPARRDPAHLALGLVGIGVRRRSPAPCASDRNQSMWQEETEATRASSGSTPAGSDIGTGTTSGEEEAGDDRAAVEAPFVPPAVAHPRRSRRPSAIRSARCERSSSSRSFRRDSGRRAGEERRGRPRPRPGSASRSAGRRARMPSSAAARASRPSTRAPAAMLIVS